MKDLPTHSSQATSKCLAPSNGSSCKTNCGAGRAGPAHSAARPAASGWDQGGSRGRLKSRPVPHPTHLSGRWRRQVWFGGDPCQGPTVSACHFPGRRPLAWLRGIQILPSPFPRPSVLVLGWAGDGRLWEHEVIQPSLLSGSQTYPG